MSGIKGVVIFAKINKLGGFSDIEYRTFFIKAYFFYFTSDNFG